MVLAIQNPIFKKSSFQMIPVFKWSDFRSSLQFGIQIPTVFINRTHFRDLNTRLFFDSDPHCSSVLNLQNHDPVFHAAVTKNFGNSHCLSVIFYLFQKKLQGSSPGQCWAFRGSQGSVVINLSSPIIMRAVTLEHIPASLAPDGSISSAPKKFEVYGLRSLGDDKPENLVTKLISTTLVRKDVFMALKI